MVLRGKWRRSPRQALEGRLPVARPQPRRMEFGHAMIAASLAGALALLTPPLETLAPNGLLSHDQPYSAVASGPVSNQPGTLNDQDTALCRQGLAAARNRDVSG